MAIFLQKLFSLFVLCQVILFFCLIIWIFCPWDSLFGLLLFVLGVQCFFVKGYYDNDIHKGQCIKDTGFIQSKGTWGNLSILGLTDNSCLDPAAQFRFRDNGAMFNVERQGCLAAFNRNVLGYDLDMFYVYVDSVSPETAACANKPNEGIHRAISQNRMRGLSVQYKGKNMTLFQTWCAVSRHHDQLSKVFGISYYIGLTTDCHNRSTTQTYVFGQFMLKSF